MQQVTDFFSGLWFQGFLSGMGLVVIAYIVFRITGRSRHTTSFVDIQQEVHARKVAEERLRRKHAELREVEDKLKDIAHIHAHEIRGPLATLIGLTAIFNEHELSDLERKLIVEGIRTTSAQLDNIICEIIRKADASELPVTEEGYAVHEILRMALAS
jgi:signal transduction histidine kinase